MRYRYQNMFWQEYAIGTFSSCIRKALNSLDNYQASGSRESIETTHEFLSTAEILLLMLLEGQDGLRDRYSTLLSTLYHIRHAEQIGDAELKKISEVRSVLMELKYQLSQLKERNRKGFAEALKIALPAK